MVHRASANLSRTDPSPLTMPPLPADADLDLEPDADSELDAPARSGIQSIEVGFRLLEVLTHTSG
ncbi:hypothetical protein NLQ80_26240, partial [Escherichia coli]|nr:hypothetical protein [Escherichia coli]